MLKKIDRLFIATALIAWLSSCAKKSESTCNCTFDEILPEPAKIVRKGSGFEPTVYSFSLDLLSGDAAYEKTDELNSGEACWLPNRNFGIISCIG